MNKILCLGVCLAALAACAQENVAANVTPSLASLCENNHEHCEVLPPDAETPYERVIYK